MPTPQLLVVPDQDGYEVEDNNSVVFTKVDGGQSRARRDYLGAAINVTVTWTLSPDEFQYLRAFYNYVNKGADPFLLDLLIESATLRTHVCRFKPGTFKIAKVKGATITVKAQLEAAPNDEGLDYADIVANYEPPAYEAPPAPVDWGTEEPWVDP